MYHQPDIFPVVYGFPAMAINESSEITTRADFSSLLFLFCGTLLQHNRIPPTFFLICGNKAEWKRK